MNKKSYPSFSEVSNPVEAAQICLKTWGEKDIPIQPIVLAHAVGVEVKMSNLDEDILATYTPAEGKKAACILYTSGVNEIRERFAIAHALGHHCLNHGIMQDTMDSYKKTNLDPRHQASNTFALSLLLPESEIQRAIEHRIASTMEGLTRLFGVSETALMLQLSALGFFNKKF